MSGQTARRPHEFSLSAQCYGQPLLLRPNVTLYVPRLYRKCLTLPPQISTGPTVLLVQLETVNHCTLK